MISWILRSPTLTLAICAFRSPRVLLRHPHVVGDHRQQVLVHHAVAHQAHRRDAQPFLLDLRQAARQRGRHRAADIGVVDVAAGEAHQLAVAEHRLPDMRIRRVRGDMTGIRIAGDADIALAIVEPFHHAAIVEAGEPGRAEAEWRGDRQSFGRHHLAGEILGLLHEGGMRGAHQRPAHALRRRGAVIREYLQRGGIEVHCAVSRTIRRLV